MGPRASTTARWWFVGGRTNSACSRSSSPGFRRSDRAAASANNASANCSGGVWSDGRRQVSGRSRSIACIAASAAFTSRSTLPRTLLNNLSDRFFGASRFNDSVKTWNSVTGTPREAARWRAASTTSAACRSGRRRGRAPSWRWRSVHCRLHWQSCRDDPRDEIGNHLLALVLEQPVPPREIAPVGRDSVRHDELGALRHKSSTNQPASSPPDGLCDRVGVAIGLCWPERAVCHLAGRVHLRIPLPLAERGDGFPGQCLGYSLNVSGGRSGATHHDQRGNVFPLIPAGDVVVVRQDEVVGQIAPLAQRLLGFLLQHGQDEA